MMDDEDEIPTMVGRADAGHDEAAGDDLPGFYIPDPESRNGYRIWWVKRQKQQNGPNRPPIGYRR
jgi:hypothetical protein